MRARTTRVEGTQSRSGELWMPLRSGSAVGSIIDFIRSADIRAVTLPKIEK